MRQRPAHQVNVSRKEVSVRRILCKCFRHPVVYIISVTRWTNVNLQYLPDSIEIASLEGLTFRCLEINQSKQPLAW